MVERVLNYQGLPEKRFDISDALATALHTAYAANGLGHHSHARRSLSLVLASEVARPLLLRPGVWRTALRAVVSDSSQPDVAILVAVGPPGNDPDDLEAARDAMSVALKLRVAELVSTLRPLFALVARPRDVDAAFLVAVAWPHVPSLQVLSRHFQPSRDCLRRCRLVRASSKSQREKDDVGHILGQLCRSPGQK